MITKKLLSDYLDEYKKGIHPLEFLLDMFTKYCDDSIPIEPPVMPACHSECLIKNNDGEQCGAKSKRGYFCSRLPNHKGDHIACGVECSMDVWTAEDEVILKSLVMLKILEAQQAIDNSIFSENGTQKVLYKKKEELKTILSKFSR